MPGELYLGGLGVARGYHQRDELTQERFVPHPFDPTGPARLYRTGDLVRYLPDGQLEFLGRIDQQLKIRGYRIEPGEIESTLGAHPQVQEAAVVASVDATNEARLVAHVVPSNPALTVESLETFFTEQLPRHLHPSAIVWHDRLPRLPGGKIDRRALPPPSSSTNSVEEKYAAPNGPLETQLAEVWADVLGVARVGRHDNFFALGGDSIRSIQVISRAAARGLRLSPKQLFQHQTIAQLAPHVGAIAIDAEQGPVVGPTLLTPIQHQLFALDPAELHHFNQSLLLEVRTPLKHQTIDRAIQHMMAHHDALRHRFTKLANSTWQQHGQPIEERPLLETVDLTNIDRAALPSAIERVATDYQASLDLSAGPLLRAIYFDLGPQRHARLLLIVHHLVVDAVSWRLLLDDLCLACSQLVNHLPVELPRKTTSFAAWASRLASWSTTDAVLPELDYWRSQTAATPVRNDHELGPDDVASADSVELQLAEDVTSQLLHAANEAYHTRPQELLVTALAMALAEHARDACVAIELEGHGREALFDDVDLSRTVGWFTSLYPLAIDFSSCNPLGDRLCYLKERLRHVPHAGLGFGALRWLAPPTVQQQLATLPRPDISFNYLGQFDHLLPADALFALAYEPTGLQRSLLGMRPHTWEILAYIRHGRLHVSWNYSQNRHRRDTIQQLTASFARCLHELISHTLIPGAGRATPSDFPAAQLAQPDLDRLSRQFDDPSLQNVADILTLAPLQQLMFAHAVAQPHSNLLVEQFQCRLDGLLDDARLTAAWQSVVTRHPLLRTGFAWDGLDHPVQVIRQQLEATIEIIDLPTDSLSASQARLTDRMTEDRRRGFALDRAPLHRLRLYRAVDGPSWLVWTCHHLIVDGWSLGIIINELFETYHLLGQGIAPETGVQSGFRNFLLHLARTNTAMSERAWSKLLHQCPPPLWLSIQHDPTDLVPRPTQPVPPERRLTAELTARLNQCATTQRQSLALLLEAVWAILLSRYAEQHDLVYGVAVAGRPPHVPDIERAVGPFMNNIPRRLRLSDEQRLSDVLSQLSDQQTHLQPHESTPIDTIVRAAGLPDGFRLFDTLLVFENYPLQPKPSATVDGLTIRDLHGTTSSNYLLSLVVLPGPELTLRLNYDPRRCTFVAVKRLLDQLVALLDDLTQRPEATLTSLSLLDEKAHRELVERWPDPTVRVLDCNAQPLPAGMTGEVWTPVTTDMATPDTALDPFDSTGRQRLRRAGYRALLNDHGEIEYRGPSQSTIRIDGYSADPAEVNAVLALHPLVAESAVIELLDRVGRRQLAALVVPSASAHSLLESRQHGLLLDQLRRHASQRLPAWLVPRVWRTFAELPRNAQGEIDRAQLPELTSVRSQSLAPYVAPRDELESRLCAIWSELLGVEPVGVTDSFLDLGGYSSQAVSLLARLEDEFDRRLPLGLLFDQPTVEHLAALLRRNENTPQEASLVPLRPGKAHPPLFCIHPAGGTVFCYLQLAQLIDPAVPVYGLQALGLDGQVAPHNSIEAMAAHYIDAIKSVAPTGPYRLCGWSTGGIIAFETARQLRALGDEVQWVAMFDAGLPRADATFDQQDLDAQLRLLFPGESPEQWAKLRQRSPEEQLAEFRRRAEAAQLVLSTAAPSQAKHIYDVFQANMQAVIAYRPRSCEVPLLVLRAARHSTAMQADPTLGWQPWTTASIQVFDLDAEHLEMLQEPAVRQVAQLLAPYLPA